jgi:hypothetical protein
MNTIKRRESNTERPNLHYSYDEFLIRRGYLFLLLAVVAAVSGIIGFTIAQFVYLSHA